MPERDCELSFIFPITLGELSMGFIYSYFLLTLRVDEVIVKKLLIELITRCKTAKKRSGVGGYRKIYVGDKGLILIYRSLIIWVDHKLAR
jgi:hypothetical protein